MNRSKVAAYSLASIVIGAAVLAAAGFALASAQPHQAALVATPLGTTTINVNGTQKVVNHASLHFSVYPDSLAGEHGASGGAHPDWVSYSNSNLVVPAHTLVTLTIDQYDSGGALNNSFFGNVLGTRGGTATVGGKVVRSVDPNDVGHTFTIRSTPGNGPYLFVSVPLPANNATDTPVTIGSGQYPKPLAITFSFLTGNKGQVYQWNCEYPCGGSRIGQFGEAMSTYGYMSGTMTVN